MEKLKINVQRLQISSICDIMILYQGLLCKVNTATLSLMKQKRIVAWHVTEKEHFYTITRQLSTSVTYYDYSSIKRGKQTMTNKTLLRHDFGAGILI